MRNEKIRQLEPLKTCSLHGAAVVPDFEFCTMQYCILQTLGRERREASMRGPALLAMAVVLETASTLQSVEFSVTRDGICSGGVYTDRGVAIGPPLFSGQ
jgi:hypothetical protein